MRAAFAWLRTYRGLTGVGVLCVVALGLGFATGFWLLFRLGYVLGAVIIAAYAWSRYNLSGLEVEVSRFGDRAQVGQVAQERITVRNRGLFPRIWLEVDDPSDLPGHHGHRVITLGARRLRTWRIQTRLSRRGVYRIGPLRVAGGDPFGLFRIERAYGRAGQVIVYPPFVDLASFQVPPASLPGEGRYRKRTHYVTPNASGVREYVPGDSFNRIHWRTTARTGRLMVKTFELDPASDIWVVLDLERRWHAGTGDESTEEYAVKVAASVARHFLVQNRNVGYMAFGDRLEIIEVERGPQQMTHILEALATCRAGGDVPLADLLAVEGKRFGRHTTVVVVTPSTDERWIASLQMLTSRGVKAAAALLEASTFGGPHDAIQAIATLTAADIFTYLVKQGADLSTSLTPGLDTAPAAPPG